MRPSTRERDFATTYNVDTPPRQSTRRNKRQEMASFLPQHDGWLPSWLLLVPSSHPHPLNPVPNTCMQVAVISVGNTVQAFLTPRNTRQVYAQSGQEITSLSSRIFGTYTFVSAVIRLYAAYNISNPQLYQLAMWAYLIAWGHFFSEWLVFGTAAWGKGLAGPVFISTGSLVWMFSQWGYYVQ